MQHFTPFGWLPLSVFTGTLAGGGQVLAKAAGHAGMPPYALIGIVGFVWASCSVVLMLGGGLANRVGLPFPPVISFGQMWGLGYPVILTLIAGGIFWLENLARFDAINKAPLITYVLVTVELVAGISALGLDLIIMWRQGRVPTVSWYEVGAVALAIGSIVLFTLAPPRNIEPLV